MPLTAKELARFLWEQPEECRARGLEIHQVFFGTGRRYRNLDLGPYGVAQLVNVRYSPSQHWFHVQVICFTTNYITAKEYHQTQRHLTAIRNTLLAQIKAAGITAQIAAGTVLIGRQIAASSDFVYTLNEDRMCQAFTYEYRATGVWFEPVGAGWHIPGAQQQPALVQLGTELLLERQRALDALVPVRTEWISGLASAPGELSGTLVVTAAGIVENRDMLEKGEVDE